MVKVLEHPTTVRQTDFSAGKGNALQACVASVFGLRLEDVPNFITAADIGYFAAIQQFVAPHHWAARKQSLSLSSTVPKEEDVGKTCLLRGKSPRGNHGHVVVARIIQNEQQQQQQQQDEANPTFEFVMDPHPDDSFLDNSEAYGWYIVFDDENIDNINSSGNNPHALKHSQDSGEMFDIMEAPSTQFDMYKDRPIPTGKQKARAAVHKDGDWHRSVHIWLVDLPNGNIALQKRSPNKDTFPNRWDISAAGHVELGVSDSRETAVRELAEELGIDDIQNPKTELQFVFTCPAEQAGIGGCNCYEDVYLLQRDQEHCHVKLGEAEVTAFKWMPIQELEHMLRSRNDEYVPRVDPYLDAFFRHLDATATAK